MEIERVGVVGCGLMGSGIVEICARSGLSIVVAEVDEQSAERGRDRVERSFERAVSSGKLSQPEASEASSRITYVTDMGDLADRQLVIEAVVELEEKKKAVFAVLDQVVEPGAILATNTSSLPIARLGAQTKLPERFLGMHFFNPVSVMPLVEIVPSMLTSSVVTLTVERFLVDTLNKQVIHSKDRSGFVVNSLLVPFLLSAIRMVENGFAEAPTVDAGMEVGCAHPLGPLRLADLIGLDTLLLVAEALHSEYREPQFVPPQLLLRMVDSGLLGRKNGRGFYQY